MANNHASFFMVPGAWHQPAAFENLIAELSKAGLSAVISSLPSCNSQNPHEATCEADADFVHQKLLDLLEAGGNDVVVVCFSYGGIPGGAAARGLSKSARIKQGKKNGVIGLIYVSAFVVPANASVQDLMGGKHPPYVDENQPVEHQCLVKGARDVFYHDVDDVEAERLVSLLRPTSLRAFDSGAPIPAWAEPEFAGRLAFIECTQDHALPPFIQQTFTAKSGVEWNLKSIEASHSPFASKPKEMVKILGEYGSLFST